MAAGVVGLLVVHVGLATTAVGTKGVTFDEPAHLVKGHAHWKLGDYRLVPDHPPLAQAWATLPLLAGGLKFPTTEQAAWRRSQPYTVGKQFLYEVGNDAASMLRRSRFMITLASAALGAAVFVWSRRLFGTAGGFVSLCLYVFSPTMLAHGALVTTDLFASMFMLASMGTLWWVFHRLSVWSLVACGAAMAGMFLSKYSAGLIVPMGVALFVVRLMGGRGWEVRLSPPLRRGGWGGVGKVEERAKTSDYEREKRGDAKFSKDGDPACQTPPPAPPCQGGWKRGLSLRGRGSQIAAAAGVLAFIVLFTWAAIWAAFGFRYDAMVNKTPGVDQFFTADVVVPAGQTEWDVQAREMGNVGETVAWAREHRLLPESYLYGFLSMMQWARGRDNFLNGERSVEGWWYFFPLSFLYKEPLSMMGVAIAAVAAFVWFGGRVGREPGASAAAARAMDSVGLDEVGGRLKGLARLLYETAPLWVLFVVYWLFALNANINIGHRHLLPTLAPLFILCGAAGVWLRRKGAVSQAAGDNPHLGPLPKKEREPIAKPQAVVRFVVPGLLCVLAGTSVWMWPDYLAYFNLIAGGPTQGYRHLVASSLDWGQDLPGLERWIEKNHRAGEPVYVSYHGTGKWGRPAAPIRGLPATLSETGVGRYAPAAGVYCISATRLQQVYLLPSSKWTPEYEKEYRSLMPESETFERSDNTAAVRSAVLAEMSPGFRGRFNRFQKLRFGRLCGYLRGREPDEFVGYSILVYRLTEEQVRAGLYGEVGDTEATP